MWRYPLWRYSLSSATSTLLNLSANPHDMRSIRCRKMVRVLALVRSAYSPMPGM